MWPRRSLFPWVNPSNSARTLPGKGGGALSLLACVCVRACACMYVHVCVCAYVRVFELKCLMHSDTSY